MKRIFIAFALMAVTVAASVFEMGYVGGKTEKAVERIKQIDALVRAEDYLSARQECISLEKDWNQTAEKIDTLLIHDYVDSIGLNISKMLADIENKNAALYFGESAGAKKGLASIQGSEYPNVENIL